MWWSAKAGMPALRTEIDHTVNRSFVLDTGVPYPIDLSVDVLFVDELPLGRFDPLQPLRGAAFGGCLLAPENEDVAVSEALERVDRKIRVLRACVTT
jgi:hypothetical protein